MTAANGSLLGDFLATAVRMLVADRRGWPAWRLQARADLLPDPVASGGDLALYAGKRGQTAAAVADLAEAIAVALLLAPPGQVIRIAGEEFRADDPWAGGVR